MWSGLAAVCSTRGAPQRMPISRRRIWRGVLRASIQLFTTAGLANVEQRTTRQCILIATHVWFARGPSTNSITRLPCVGRVSTNSITRLPRFVLPPTFFGNLQFEVLENVDLKK